MKRSIVLNEDQLWSYVNCPVQYDLAYNQKVIPPKPSMFNNYVQQIAKRFLTNLMVGTVLDGNKLKRLWDKICDKNPDIDPQRCTEGVGKLISMYNWAAKVRLRILDVTVPYILLFQRKDGMPVEISGEIPTIALTDGGEPELLVFDWSDKHTNQLRVDMNLYYTLQCYAYYKKTGKNLGIHVHNIKHHDDLYSYRGKFDYQRLYTTISNIGFSIEHNIYYPRENPLCLNCHAVGACRSWY